jgi:beta-lactamase superfamily II metal-dependent hydrolase
LRFDPSALDIKPPDPEIPMLKKIILPLILLTAFLPSFAAPPARRVLEIYYVDVEGGAATLIVTPAGESILVDAGWPGFENRDAKRIQAALQQAGVTQIDHLIMTHYHIDHYGGIAPLAKLVQIKRFYDRGPLSPELGEYKSDPKMHGDYLAATAGKSTHLKPGDTIKLKTVSGMPAVRLWCLASSAEVVRKSGGAPNAECAAAVAKPEDTSDNARSVVLKLSYGDFDFLDTGDLTWNIEKNLVCPTNLIGEIDLYQVGHHGMDTSNNPVLLRSIRPTVAIMNNGAKKGGSATTVRDLLALPSLKALYQVHRNIKTGDADNAPAEFIANPDEQGNEMIRVSVDAAARSFTVINDRTKVSKTFSFK